MEKEDSGMRTEEKDLKIPPVFSGPAQLLLYTRYGDPRSAGWENRWITNWKVGNRHPWFPLQEIKIHKHFWPMLDVAFTKLEQLGLQDEIKTFFRGFQLFHLHDSPVLSVHSWGAAIDLNAEINPIGSIGNWSEGFIDVMKAHGIFCGQCWTGTKEPMHFGMVEGE